MMLRTLLAVAVLAGGFSTLAAEPTPTPAPASDHAAPLASPLMDKLKAANDFTATWTLGGDGRNATGSLWWQRPDKVRIQTGSLELVIDGTRAIMVMHDSKSFLGGPVDWPRKDGGLRSGDLPFFAKPMLYPQGVIDALQGVAGNATFEPSDNSLVVTIPRESERQDDTTVTYTDIRLDAPPAEDWFATKAPEDYRDVTGLEAKPTFKAMDLVDQPAPPVGGIPRDGQLRSLAELRGNVVVVDFWASWCEPCVRTLPMYGELSRELAAEGVVFVGINNDEYDTLDAARAFARDKKIDFPLVFGNHGPLMSNWKVQTLPTMFIVRPDGIVHYAHVGAFHDAGELRKLIAEARRSTPAGPHPAAPATAP